MSRIAKQPVNLPEGVVATLEGQSFTVKGPKGELSFHIHRDVEVMINEENVDDKPSKLIKFKAKSSEKSAKAQSGTARAIINNMVQGVSQGFVKELELVGVGYRAQASGEVINLSLGFSHPVAYELIEGVTAETPSNTQIVLTGIDKQKVGQVAAEIRKLRPPEPYKGKGVRYKNEQIIRKEAKKK